MCWESHQHVCLLVPAGQRHVNLARTVNPDNSQLYIFTKTGWGGDGHMHVIIEIWMYNCSMHVILSALWRKDHLKWCCFDMRIGMEKSADCCHRLLQKPVPTIYLLFGIILFDANYYWKKQKIISFLLDRHYKGVWQYQCVCLYVCVNG